MDEKYLQKIVENEQRSRSNTLRLEKLEREFENQRELVISVKEIANEVKHMREDFNDMNSRLKEVERRPGKRYEQVISIIITRYGNGYTGLFFS